MQENPGRKCSACKQIETLRKEHHSSKMWQRGLVKDGKCRVSVDKCVQSGMKDYLLAWNWKREERSGAPQRSD